MDETTPTPPPSRLEIVLLFVGLLIFTGVLLVIEKYFQSDNHQVFQVIAGIVAAFSGAFFAKIKTS